ncbi:MAG: hypothetical protein ABW076_06450 [Candidatus Thiodiazotropha sp.]
MTASPLKPKRLAAIGMDQRQRNALRVLFASQCQNRFVLVEEESSEICILDLDVFGGERLWQEFRQRHSQRPLILVSLKPRTIDNELTLFVQKPIPVARLIDAIEQQVLRLDPNSSVLTECPPAPDTPVETDPCIVPDTQPTVGKPAAVTRRVANLMSETQERAFVGTAPDIDPQDPRQLARVYYNPDHYLQGHIQQALNLAVRYHKNVSVEGPWPAMDLMIDSRTLLIDANERQIRPFCTVPDTTLEVPLRVHDHHHPDSGRQGYPVTAFLWQLALWASRGRLPAGTSLTQPIYLRHWPNFTRLQVTPHALAIAALWAKQPRSLIDTARGLQIPQRYVFAFYSAAKALQLAGETRRAVDTLIAPAAVRRSARRGVLIRLLDHLRGHRKTP